jgi:hypothetical protein
MGGSSSLRVRTGHQPSIAPPLDSQPRQHMIIALMLKPWLEQSNQSKEREHICIHWHILTVLRLHSLSPGLVTPAQPCQLSTSSSTEALFSLSFSLSAPMSLSQLALVSAWGWLGQLWRW